MVFNWLHINRQIITGHKHYNMLGTVTTVILIELGFYFIYQKHKLVNILLYKVPTTLLPTYSEIKPGALDPYAVGKNNASPHYSFVHTYYVHIFEVLGLIVHHSMYIPTCLFKDMFCHDDTKL
jgi:hypothetical protein